MKIQTINVQNEQHHLWTHISEIVNPADLWTYLIREFNSPNPLYNPPFRDDYISDSKALISQFLYQYDYFAIYPSGVENPNYDPKATKNPGNPKYDPNKIWPDYMVDCSGLQIQGDYPNRAFSIKLREDWYDASHKRHIDVSGLMLMPDGLDGLPGGLMVHLCTNPDTGYNESGLALWGNWGLSIFPANNSIVILARNPQEPVTTWPPSGGVSVKLAANSGLCITDASQVPQVPKGYGSPYVPGGVAIKDSDERYPNGRGLQFDVPEGEYGTAYPTVRVKTRMIPGPENPYEMEVPNPDYEPPSDEEAIEAIEDIDPSDWADTFDISDWLFLEKDSDWDHLNQRYSDDKILEVCLKQAKNEKQKRHLVWCREKRQRIRTEGWPKAPKPGENQTPKTSS